MTQHFFLSTGFFDCLLEVCLFRLSRFSRIFPLFFFLLKNRPNQIPVHLQCMDARGGHGLTTTHGEKAQTSKFSEYFHFFFVSLRLLCSAVKNNVRILHASTIIRMIPPECNRLGTEGSKNRFSYRFKEYIQTKKLSKYFNLYHLSIRKGIFSCRVRQRFRRPYSDQIRTIYTRGRLHYSKNPLSKQERLRGFSPYRKGKCRFLSGMISTKSECCSMGNRIYEPRIIFLVLIRL